MTATTDLHLLRAIIRQHLPRLIADFHVETIELFGSYVHGEQESDSDLDVLVTFSETPGLLEFVALENDLGDLLGVKVDLVMKNALKPEIGAHIIRGAIPV